MGLTSDLATIGKRPFITPIHSSAENGFPCVSSAPTISAIASLGDTVQEFPESILLTLQRRKNITIGKYNLQGCEPLSFPLIDGEASGMRAGLVECKECRFWIQYPEEDLELKPGMVDIGLCHQFRSPNWLFRMHREEGCGYGELKAL